MRPRVSRGRWGRATSSRSCRTSGPDAGSEGGTSGTGDLVSAAGAGGGEAVVRERSLGEPELFYSRFTAHSTTAFERFSLAHLVISCRPQQRVLFVVGVVAAVQCPVVRHSVSAGLLTAAPGARGHQGPGFTTVPGRARGHQGPGFAVVASEAAVGVKACGVLAISVLVTGFSGV